MTSDSFGSTRKHSDSKRHICMVVTTDFIHDRRVRKEALSVLEADYRLTVIAMQRPEDEVYKAGLSADNESDGFPFKLKRISLGGRMRMSEL